MVSMPAMVLALALGTASSDVVLLDFTAPWCAPCRDMEPTIGRLQQSGYPVRQINVDEQPELASRYAVRSVPCLVLLADGVEVDRVVGASSYARLERMFHNAGFRPGQPAGPPAAARPRPTEPTQDRVTAIGRGAQRRALAATVRLKVEDAGGYSFGTGTVIDTHGSEALVLTCGHLFRDSRGEGPITVDLFHDGRVRQVTGRLLAYNHDDYDLALVSIQPGCELSPVRVAGLHYQPQPGFPVFSLGCDHGESPSVRTGDITSVNRYLGPPNLEVRGRPVEGRSGGGLFNADGELIGVCNAADVEEDRGIYAALPVIQFALRQIGQESLFAESTAIAQATPPPREDPVRNASPRLPGPPSVSSAGDIPDLSTAAVGANPALDVRPARFDPPAAGEGPPEILCIVRQPGGSGGESVLVIERPSAELLERLLQESRSAAIANAGSGGRTPRLADDRDGPIVRAQSER